MAARAYGRETIATLPIDDDKDWKNREISNVKNLGVNEHITLLARGKKRNVYPTLNRYDSETDGWYVSKDNGDVERKFFKDDFSVDSSSQYTFNASNYTFGDGVVVGDTTPAESEKYFVIEDPRVAGESFSVVWSSPSFFEQSGSQEPGIMFRFPHGIECLVYHSDVTSPDIIYRFGRTSSYTSTLGNLILWKRVTLGDAATVVAWFKSTHRLDVVKLNSTQFSVYMDGVLIGTASTTFNELCGFSISPYRYNKSVNIYEITSSPSISYADDFTTDTTERYQAVSGTVTYVDANKRMNVTTATGANGKASGRLKSYKFCEGAQQFDVTLPVGADGDFICMVTHATNPAMTNGIGVGLQSDGAGNWNLVTLSGTTVTVGASSGLVDGKTARIEIEKDLSGAYWYYIYDAAGAKPTTATGKLFTTKSEGYTGWYANGAGATTQTYAIDNISIRAESIVGRTNVQVEEPFWFRDECKVNALGRYATTRFSFETDHYVLTGSGAIRTPVKFSDFVAEAYYTVITDDNARTFEFTFCDDGTSNLDDRQVSTGNHHIISFDWQGDTVSSRSFINGVSTIHETKSFSLVPGTEYKFKLVKSGTTVLVYAAPSSSEYGDAIMTFEATILTPGYVLAGGGSAGSSTGSYSIRLDLFAVSGTRVYNKPIHRGAMLETYHDGTQEVVGTAFIDDCQWDRSVEYVSRFTPTWDTINGCITLNQENEYIKVKDSYTYGYLRFKSAINTTGQTSASYRTIYFLNESSVEGTIRFVLGLTTSNTLIWYLSRYTGSAWSDLVSMVDTTTYTHGTLLDIELLMTPTTISVWCDGVLKLTTTATYNGICSPQLTHESNGGATSFDWKIYNIQIIAASSDATNGIAACIPPIGGGARYGEQEKVYKQLVNAAKFGEYKTTASIKTTNADAEAIEMYFKNITDTTNVTTDDTDTLAISLSDTNYATSTKDLQLLHGDRNDTIEVAVRKTAAATPVSPACYITDLMILPKTEG